MGKQTAGRAGRGGRDAAGAGEAALRPRAVTPVPGATLSPLARELGKVRPFEHAEQEAALALVRTVALQQGEIEQIFKREGLSGSTYNILRILRHAPDGRSCSEVGSQLVARVPDVTRLLDGLEKRHLIERHRSSTDRRVVRVRITSAGLAALARLDEPVLAAHRRHFAALKKSEVQQLIDLLARCREWAG
jgi:DNA-binding MarR family transcriptional regulator